VITFLAVPAMIMSLPFGAPAIDVTRIGLGLLRAGLENAALGAAHGAAARIAAALTAGKEPDIGAAIHQAMFPTSDAVPTERAGKHRVRLAR
jgi:hypothetical protein